MYNVRTNWACIHIKIETVCSRTLGFILKIPSYSERRVKKFEEVVLLEDGFHGLPEKLFFGRRAVDRQRRLGSSICS